MKVVHEQVHLAEETAVEQALALAAWRLLEFLEEER